jgi:hypothetical protein
MEQRVSASYQDQRGIFFSKLKPGSKLLELGSRARSGNVVEFGQVDYTGVDIMAGPNVDIVADVHYLSEAGQI